MSTIRIILFSIVKGLYKKKSTQELASTVIHPRKMISIFHKDCIAKSTATLSLKDSTLPIAKLITKLAAKPLRLYPKKKRKTNSRY